MKTKILEFDDNNRTADVYTNSSINAVSVKLSDAEDEFNESLFEHMDGQTRLICDFGGGNDSKKISMLQESGIDFTYIIPLTASLAQAKNARDTYNLIEDKTKIVFALNQVHNIDAVKKEFCFFYGSQELSLDSLYEEMGNPKTIIIPHTPLFELAALQGITIGELASIANGIKKEESSTIFFEKANGDKALFKSLRTRYTQALLAANYLNEVMPQLKSLQGNLACLSTKGGAGKSTISFNLFPLIGAEDGKKQTRKVS